MGPKNVSRPSGGGPPSPAVAHDRPTTGLTSASSAAWQPRTVNAGHLRHGGAGRYLARHAEWAAPCGCYTLGDDPQITRVGLRAGGAVGFRKPSHQIEKQSRRDYICC